MIIRYNERRIIARSLRGAASLLRSRLSDKSADTKGEMDQVQEDTCSAWIDQLEDIASTLAPAQPNLTDLFEQVDYVYEFHYPAYHHDTAGWSPAKLRARVAQSFIKACRLASRELTNSTISTDVDGFVTLSHVNYDFALKVWAVPTSEPYVYSIIVNVND